MDVNRAVIPLSGPTTVEEFGFRPGAALEVEVTEDEQFHVRLYYDGVHRDLGFDGEGWAPVLADAIMAAIKDADEGTEDDVAE